MPLAQDPCKQKSRKIYKTLHLKEDAIKLSEDPIKCWIIKEYKSGSENENVDGTEKNLRFDDSSGECSLPESEYSNEDEAHMEAILEGKYSYEKRHCCHSCGVTDYRKACAARGKTAHPPRQLKPENARGRNSKDGYDNVARRFPSKQIPTRYKSKINENWECEDKMHRCEERHNRHQLEEPKNDRKTTMLSNMKPFKHVHPLKKERSSESKWKGKEEEYHSPECVYHKHKKRLLDRCEELPAVEEVLERRSDETYKASSYTKLAMNVRDSQANFQQNQNNDDKLYERSPSWYLCNKMGDTAVNVTMPYKVYPDRTVKTRSWRTRIDRRRSIKWTKALIHPVVEGSQRKKVGVMILGQNGPEYYSKYSSKKSCIPFRKTRSFPEGPTKSYDMPINFEQKKISFSASEPGWKPRSELRTPEEDNKIEQKIANFDKNVDELVKNMQEKFLESISKDKFEEEPKGAQSPKSMDPKVGNVEESKKNLSLMPRELLSSRAPKQTRTYDRDVFAFNVESKTMAENLNERVKEYRIGQKNDLSELEKKFPPKALDKETRDANLTLWGMNKQRESREVSDAGGEGDGKDLELRISIRRNSECTETQSKSEAEEKSKDRSEVTLPKKDSCENEPEAKAGKDQNLFDIFKDLVKDGSAITEKESKKLQKMLQSTGYEAEVTSSEIESKTSCETIREKDEESKRESSNRKNLQNGAIRNVKSGGHKWGSGKFSKKRDINLEKLKMIREALPSMAAENEAAHLKQLKKYIHTFIDGVENKISSSSEVRGSRLIKCKQRDTTSSDSSEVRVDARKLIDLVSNPFKRITSDMTIDMAKKLTDALVQENSSKTAKKLASKNRKNSEATEDVSFHCPTTSRSDGEDEAAEPKYLENLKKMRNDHLSNIMTEVRRLRELIRFLDRCNRLKL